MKERYKLIVITGLFLISYYLPWSHPTIRQAGLEAFMMLQEYAREHVHCCGDDLRHDLRLIFGLITRI